MTGWPFTVTKGIALSTVPLTAIVEALTSVGRASIVTAGGVESRVTVRLLDPWLPAGSTATRVIVFAPSTSETGTSNDPSARTVAGIPATVKEADSLTTPEMTVRSLFVRTPAELLTSEMDGAAESRTTVIDVRAVFPFASVAVTSMTLEPSTRATTALNAPVSSTLTLELPTVTAAVRSVRPCTVTLDELVAKPAVGARMSSTGADVSTVNDHEVVAMFPAKSPAWTRTV